MIFAHIGLASNYTGSKTGFSVSYDWGVNEVFTRAAFYFMQQGRDVLMLRESQNIAPTEHCLPSWVPHWNAPISSPQSPSPYELPRSIETEPPRL
jgi:hypothetical protein